MSAIAVPAATNEVFLAQDDATREWAIRRRALEAARHGNGAARLRPRWRDRVFSVLLGMLDRGLRLTPLHRRGVRNALDLRLTEFELALDGLPSGFDGYRILHVSDTHLDTLPAIAEVARRMLNGVEADLLALTGDIHGRRRHPVSLSVDLLECALSGVHIHDRRLAVLGNHDSVDMPEALQRLGFETLINRSVVLTRNGDSVRVTGLDDVHSFYHTRRTRGTGCEGRRISHRPRALGRDGGSCRGSGIRAVSLRSHARRPDLPARRPGHLQPARPLPSLRHGIVA